MHLKDYPQYYVKGSERRAVYFTGDARDLRSQGWHKEEPKAAPQEAPPAEAKVSLIKPEKVEVDVIIEEPQPKDLPDFDFMTKVELLSYAMDKGVDLPNNMLKADLVAECKRLAEA